MSILGRNHVLGEVMQRKVRSFRMVGTQNSEASVSLKDVFGCNRFGHKEYKKYLPAHIHEGFLHTLKMGSQIPHALADAIAQAVKTWAIQKGVTHYCHWFQPQTGSTAEKHDALLREGADGAPIEYFTGEELSQGEPDASSFPSGGMRTTFEARGYTAWDPNSPIFISETENGKTLCIPSVFISFTGEVLDKKTPLLRSMKAVDVAARKLLSLLTDDSAQSDEVVSVAGPEQEYFLIDKTFFYQRPDLILTGRIIGGLPSTRGQYLEEHYFGHIPTRVQAFMQEAEYELYRIGVVAKTRHNEVAPAQYEIAVQHQDANVAADQNQMVMAIMARVAERHDFKLLLHEKPFDGINGSGKHVNWSLRTSSGINLLSPGKTPSDYLRFLCFLASVLKGIHLFGGLIRTSIGSLSNDKRLGGHEAPPAIISVFLGHTISEIVRQISQKNFKIADRTRNVIALGLRTVPSIQKDDTDRNRTSPFAFTGNKFEYRAVGASASISFPLTVINTSVAEGISYFSDLLTKELKAQKNKEDAILQTLHACLKETQDIIFDGNNYAQEWAQEAKRRGLPNYANSLEAFEELRRPEVQNLFAKHGVLTHKELESRYHVKCERYIKLFGIECRTLIELIRQYIVPSAEIQIRHHYHVFSAVAFVTKKKHAQIANEITKLSGGISRVLHDVSELEDQLQAVSNKGLATQMKWVVEVGGDLQKNLERQIGEIEALVSSSHWSLPKVYEMLHIR